MYDYKGYQIFMEGENTGFDEFNDNHIVILTDNGKDYYAILKDGFYINTSTSTAHHKIRFELDELRQTIHQYIDELENPYDVVINNMVKIVNKKFFGLEMKVNKSITNQPDFVDQSKFLLRILEKLSND